MFPVLKCCRKRGLQLKTRRWHVTISCQPNGRTCAQLELDYTADVIGAGRCLMLIGLAYGVKTMTMLSRFHLIPERYGRTDRRTCYISVSRVSMLTRDKNSRVRVREFTYFQANSATVLPSCEWKHVAAYYFLRTINCRVDLRRLYAKVHETWHYYRTTICA